MNKSPVFNNPAIDPEMDEVNRLARQTFRYFYRELSWEQRRIIPGLDVACVKVVFTDPPDRGVPDERGAEIMWISDVSFDGRKVRGTLINQPNWLTSVREGDAVEVAPKELADWMYCIAGRVYGGFTVQLMRSRMGRRERVQHDEAWGMEFGDPQVVHVVPPEFVRAKTGWLGRMFGKAKPLTALELESHEHPMAVNMAESLSEMLSEHPERVSQSDERGFTLLHQLALAGTAIGTEILLQRKANPNAPAKNGLTPLRLANSLGWKNVAQVLAKYGAQ